MPLPVVQAPPSVLLARMLGVVLLSVCLGACGSSGSKGGGGGSAAQRGSYKIGNSYKIDGVTYTPQEEFNHVETGVASWYGPGFHGKSTANGERYDQGDRTAAHRTLQMPAIVRVTNLDNGLSTVVRINDRGPFARSRVIDLSRTAAQELDIVRNGTGRVRIEQLSAESLAVKDVALSGGGPAEQNAAVAQVASGRRSAPAAIRAPVEAQAMAPVVQAPVAVAAPPPQPNQPQPATQMVWTTNQRPPSLDAPPPPSGAVTVASLSSGPIATPIARQAGGFYVQTGSFSTADNAGRQRDAVRSYGNSEIFQGSAAGRDVFRVRLGPYTTPDAAGIVADRLKRSGYGDARVVSD